MTKLTLDDLTSLTNQTSAINTINNNNDAIVTALENTLSRDGTTPNEMEADLDMNDNRILNLPEPLANTEPVRLIDLNTALDEFEAPAGPEGPPGPPGAAGPAGDPGGPLADGDYGDITVSSTGTVFTIDDDAVTYAKIQNVSATDRLLGRVSAGSGIVEEVTCTDFAQGLLDDADAATARTTLGLGTAATQDSTAFANASHTHTASDVTDFNTAADARVAAAIGVSVQAYDAQLDSLSSASANGVSLVTAADYAAMKALLDLEIGTDVQAFDADILKADVSDNLVVGYTATAVNAGTKSSGTYTPDPTQGNLQYAVNGGAHTLAPPSNDCTIIIQYTNNGSAGAITTSGFTKVDGSFTTTDGHDFMCYITRVNAFSHLNIVALQ